jgi:uncharacterized protein YeaO (DUF488 family)
MTIRTKRIYDHADPGDGYRVLVDRIWPRGVSKERAAIDLWLKDIAPSTELRTWFGHEDERFLEFRDRYFAELEGSAALEQLRALAQTHPVITLLYGAKNETHNQAVALAQLLS